MHHLAAVDLLQRAYVEHGDAVLPELQLQGVKNGLRQRRELLVVVIVDQRFVAFFLESLVQDRGFAHFFSVCQKL